MFPIKINILPDRKKQGTEKLIKFIFFKEMLEIILLVVSVLSIVLIWNWVVLQEQFNGLTESALLVNKEFSRYNQDIKKINFVIKELNYSSKNFFPLTEKITQLSEKLPDDIKLNSVVINYEKMEIVISGVAKTRDGLLNYQSDLKKYNWLNEITTPVSQLFQKENTGFEIHAKIKRMPI